MEVQLKESSEWRHPYANRAKQEALWLRSVSASHSAWCTCGDWTQHVRGVEKRKCRLTDDEDSSKEEPMAQEEDEATKLAEAIVEDMRWDVTVDDADR
ncbi:ORF2 [Torque teno Tadarida brasiliensis virus 2]|nr:ORF2 [Torque teno Tadarida brasiliensis virus 2]